jgi:hypothetical protein
MYPYKSKHKTLIKVKGNLRGHRVNYAGRYNARRNNKKVFNNYWKGLWWQNPKLKYRGDIKRPPKDTKSSGFRW